jgi:HAD superfamily hydrolase (TIGR01450 family)
VNDPARSASLLAGHDALLVDLDGVVQLGRDPVPGAAVALEGARAAGLRVVFVTNNAARSAADVASTLTDLGVTAAPADVLTSSMAAADLLAGRFPSGTRVLVVGGAGLREPVEAAGLTPVASADEEPAAVVQGWSPDLTWALLAEAAVAVRRGAAWFATNTDATLPSPRGPLPGNGAMVGAVALATGTEPEVVGKPGRALFDAAVRVAGATRPLVVGDRLDTDIAGANAAGLPSLLVLTGVSRPADLLAAAADLRPTYVGHDLGALAGPAARIQDEHDADDGLDPLRRECRETWGSASTEGRDVGER